MLKSFDKRPDCVFGNLFLGALFHLLNAQSQITLLELSLRVKSKFLDDYLFSQNPDLFSQNSNLLLLFLPA